MGLRTKGRRVTLKEKAANQPEFQTLEERSLGEREKEGVQENHKNGYGEKNARHGGWGFFGIFRVNFADGLVQARDSGPGVRGKKEVENESGSDWGEKALGVGFGDRGGGGGTGL